MHLKRGLVLIFLLVIPLVSSDFDFQCEDRTMFGSCNDNRQCIATHGY